MNAFRLDFVVLLFLGLASSIHCVAMCGPLIAVASAPWSANRQKEDWSGLLSAQISFHLGRGLIYVLLGGILGTTGLFITQLFPSRRIGALVQIFLGCVFLAIGVGMLLPTRKVFALPSPHLLSRLLRHLITSGRPYAMIGLGLVTGILPCGVLYMVFSGCLTAGSFWRGAQWMLAFWLGTTPLLLASGIVTHRLFRLRGRAAAILVAMVMIASGSWIAGKGFYNWSQGSQNGTSINNYQDRLKAGISSGKADTVTEKCH